MTTNHGGTMATDHIVTPGEILTYSGLYVTPLDLQPEHVAITDIAHALSNQCRYSGHVSEFYSVAQHSVLVMDWLFLNGEDNDVQFAGLMHDAAEAYLQDMPRPLKEDPVFGKLYREIEAKAESVIASVFGFEHLHPFPEVVKQADVALLALERDRLMPPNGDWGLGTQESWGVRIEPWDPWSAKDAFLNEFTRLYTNH